MEESKENKMQAHQLAIVFGPTLIWPQVQSSNLATSMVYQSRIVEYVLLEYKNIFRWGYVSLDMVDMYVPRSS